VIAALRYELVRVRTVRSTWIGLGAAFVIALGLGFLIATPNEFYDESGTLVGTSVDWLGAFTFPLSVTAIAAAVLASQAIGQEYRFGIVRLTLSAFPRRARVLTAKLVVVALLSVAVAALSLLGSWLALVLRGFPSPPEAVAGPDGTFFVRGLVFMVLWAFSAFALAGITRQTAVGVAVPIVSGFIVEQILGVVLSERAEWLVRILPWSTAGRWAQTPVDVTDVGGGGGLDLPVGWAALGVFGVWVVVLLVGQVVLFLRRDA
jgi:ABC-2 type transport system permease protein